MFFCQICLLFFFVDFSSGVAGCRSSCVKVNLNISNLIWKNERGKIIKIFIQNTFLCTLFTETSIDSKWCIFFCRYTLPTPSQVGKWKQSAQIKLQKIPRKVERQKIPEKLKVIKYHADGALRPPTMRPTRPAPGGESRTSWGPTSRRRRRHRRRDSAIGPTTRGGLLTSEAVLLRYSGCRIYKTIR